MSMGDGQDLTKKFFEKFANQDTSNDAKLDFLKQQLGLHQAQIDTYGEPTKPLPKNSDIADEEPPPGIGFSYDLETAGNWAGPSGDDDAELDAIAEKFFKKAPKAKQESLNENDAAKTAPKIKPSPNQSKGPGFDHDAFLKALQAMTEGTGGDWADAPVSNTPSPDQSGKPGKGDAKEQGQGKGEGEAEKGQQQKQKQGDGKEGKSEAQKKADKEAEREKKVDEIIARNDTLEGMADELHKELPDATLWCRLMWPVTEIHYKEPDGTPMVRQEYPVHLWCPACGGNRQMVKDVIKGEKW